MADAAPPPAPARAGPVAALSALLAPAGPDAATVLALVPALRTALAASLPPGTLLWGADLLDADDAAGVTVLGKCVASRARAAAPRAAAQRHMQSEPCSPAGRPRRARRAAAHAPSLPHRGHPGSCARAT
jgi:hypothetical protein